MSMKKYYFLVSALVGIFFAGSAHALAIGTRPYPVFLFPSGTTHELSYESVQSMGSVATAALWSAPNHLPQEQVRGYVTHYQVRVTCYSCTKENTWTPSQTLYFPVDTTSFRPNSFFSTLNVGEQGFSWYKNNLVRFQIRAVYNDNYRGVYGYTFSRWSPSVYVRLTGTTTSVSDTVPPAVSVAVSGATPGAIWNPELGRYSNDFSLSVWASDAGGLKSLYYQVSTSSSDLEGSFQRGYKPCYGKTECRYLESPVFTSPPYGQTLYFRAYAVDMAGNVKLSSPVSALFARATSTSSVVTTTGSAPSITSPAMNQIITTYPRIARLQWNPVTGTERYQVELACDVCASTRTLFSAPYTFVVSGTATTTNLFAGDNQFRLRVRGIYPTGSYGAWSSETFFRFRTR
jgi:hypothetical protein